MDPVADLQARQAKKAVAKLAGAVARLVSAVQELSVDRGDARGREINVRSHLADVHRQIAEALDDLEKW